MKLEIVCAGIGGRGVLLASTIIMETAIRAGLHAMASDEYGMSQRGGSVVSLVKVGDFRSPLIGSENADILLAFEESEFYRALPFLGKGGCTIVNSGKQAFPGEIAGLLRERGVASYMIDADRIAKEKGMIRASNMAVLGFLSRLSPGPYTPEGIRETIESRVPAKAREKNVEVFLGGFALGENLKEYRRT